jgi:hypothetical protein
MTDARFPERWLNDRRVLRLPDDAFRLFVLSLAWSVANQTDGRIYDDDLALIPASPAGSGQLAKSGLWERVADYWLITVFEETQTTRADLEHLAVQRRKARDRKRRERARRARPVTQDVTRDVPEDSTRTGQARTGALTGRGDQQRTCAKDECPLSPRSGCRTCWDHAYLEATR